MMMLSLERDIPVTYCNSTKDQMVIFIAAHGYGGKNNPTQKIALKYQTYSGRTTEWITHAALWARLKQVAVIRKYPEKVRIIVYSCRSGALFDARPTELKKVGLYTSTSSGNEWCYPSFINCLEGALITGKCKSWKALFKAVEKCLKKTDGKAPHPKNG